MQKKREGANWRWLWIVAILIIVLLILLVNFRLNISTGSALDHAVLTKVGPSTATQLIAPRIQNAVTEPIDDVSIEARRKIRDAYAQLVRVSAYRRVLTCFNAGSRSVRFTLVHVRSKSGKDFFRCDTEFQSAQHPEEAISDRTEITNAAGNWELRNTPGSDEVAMLVSNSEPPNDTVAAHAAFCAEADGTSSHNHHLFAESSFADKGQSFIRIIESDGGWSAQYVLDAAGNLRSQSTTSDGNLVTTESYEIDPLVNLSIFEIPQEKISVETSNPNQASSFLWEKDDQSKKDAVLSATAK